MVGRTKYCLYFKVGIILKMKKYSFMMIPSEPDINSYNQFLVRAINSKAIFDGQHLSKNIHTLV